MVKIMEKPIRMDDLGVPLFLETPIHTYVNVCEWMWWFESENWTDTGMSLRAMLQKMRVAVRLHQILYLVNMNPFGCRRNPITEGNYIIDSYLWREPYPIGSMYGIYTYIWSIFTVNVGEYTIHGSYGYYPSLFVNSIFSQHSLGHPLPPPRHQAKKWPPRRVLSLESPWTFPCLGS